MSEIHSRSASHRTEDVAGGPTVVALRGEIDIVTALSVSARIDALTAGPRPDLVLDLRSVSFIDCAGLSLLCRARNRTLARLGRLRLVTEDLRFLRILRGAGLPGVFEIHPHLPEALVGAAEAGTVPTVAG